MNLRLALATFSLVTSSVGFAATGFHLRFAVSPEKNNTVEQQFKKLGIGHEGLDALLGGAGTLKRDGFTHYSDGRSTSSKRVTVNDFIKVYPKAALAKASELVFSNPFHQEQIAKSREITGLSASMQVQLSPKIEIVSSEVFVTYENEDEDARKILSYRFQVVENELSIWLQDRLAADHKNIGKIMAADRVAAAKAQINKSKEHQRLVTEEKLDVRPYSVCAYRPLQAKDKALYEVIFLYSKGQMKQRQDVDAILYRFRESEQGTIHLESVKSENPVFYSDRD